MNEGINLLDPNKKTSSVLLRRLKTVRVITVGLLFLISSASVMVFILVALSPLPDLQRQEQSLKDTFAQSQNDVIKLSLVDERATAINGILSNRPALDQKIGVIESKLSSDTNVTALQIDGNTMTLTVESPSLQSLDNFISSLSGMVQNKNVFGEVDLTDLSVDTLNNAYSLTLQMVLL